MNTIAQGSLVQLREKHPVIDAVTRVKDQTDKRMAAVDPDFAVCIQ